MIRTPFRSGEAQAAKEAARQSYEQAQRDLEDQQRGLVESNRAIDRLKAHNAANHFDEWLMELALKRAR